MKQPTTLNSNPETPNSITEKKKIPSPQDLISHYQSKGLDPEQASLKVIEDLQNVLVRVVSSSKASKSKQDKLLSDASRKIDSLNTRVSVVDMKLDSKPGYVQTFAIGVVSGAALNGIGTVFPVVVKGFAQIWSAVKTATNFSSPSPSESG